MSNGANWCTIESDPGVFTNLIEAFGVKNAEFSELWSLDDDSLSTLVNEFGKIYGLIFLFKWNKESYDGSGNGKGSTSKPLVGDDAPIDLFFAKQVVQNACATQAILSVLFNSDHANVDDDVSMGTEEQKNESNFDLGPTLSSFKTFTASFPPDLRGEAIGASEEIREAHNSFARRETFLVEENEKRVATDDDDVFHFIAYVPHTDGNVYELDGLQPGPIKIGSIPSKETPSHPTDLDWISVARSAIQGRIEKYSTSEIKFNLMAVVRDKRIGIQSKINAMLDAGMKGGPDGDEMMRHLEDELSSQEVKRMKWDEENARRRHNYLPFIMELVKALAGSGKLPDLINNANEQTNELRKQAIKARLTKNTTPS
mmetsp:Transcript_7165/g.10271  ORF Transcript_7165/g.10271 Transcript_7165/m.10271 type:complete len:371 (+) Transcript_7165:141-1253(+)|eukprot:CAMPEP_0184861718 /NCGR_PEP_ID=MMETSP0580-20130426/6334_1 /TAXON_ID=1118495 /ORGANISM="Dactyliosolen fragilissimus" /LENGTH=370 /DNA_ID=CAMNT_0027359309 /DNA_START=86 /DNA_END=1198 /DNA_ORIENTATION=-